VKPILPFSRLLEESKNSAALREKKTLEQQLVQTEKTGDPGNPKPHLLQAQ
jgi:hypothetical protein